MWYTHSIQYRCGIDIVLVYTSTYCIAGWPEMLSIAMPKDLPSAFRSHILRAYRNPSPALIKLLKDSVTKSAYFDRTSFSQIQYKFH